MKTAHRLALVDQVYLLDAPTPPDRGKIKIQFVERASVLAQQKYTKRLVVDKMQQRQKEGPSCPDGGRSGQTFWCSNE